MGEKRIGQSQPGKEETGTLTTKPGCGDRDDDEWMNFNEWWKNYVNAAGGGDCQPTDIAGAGRVVAGCSSAGMLRAGQRAAPRKEQSRRPGHPERPAAGERRRGPG